MAEVQESWFEELRKKSDKMDPEKRATIEGLRENWSIGAADGSFERVLDARYLENETGIFEMICRYQANEGGGLKDKMLTSQPVRFRVRNDGSFMDPLFEELEAQKATGADELLRIVGADEEENRD